MPPEIFIEEILVKNSTQNIYVLVIISDLGIETKGI